VNPSNRLAIAPSHVTESYPLKQLEWFFEKECRMIDVV